MPLLKVCRCGKLIEYSKKKCVDCESKSKIQKTNDNRYYDKYIRNKESTEIYHSKEWQELADICKRKFNGLCIYSYYVLDKVVFGNTSHHIIEVTENKERVFDLSNLIYVDASVHNLIHGEYEKSDKYKRDMQELLIGLVKRWEEEFG